MQTPIPFFCQPAHEVPTWTEEAFLIDQPLFSLYSHRRGVADGCVYREGFRRTPKGRKKDFISFFPLKFFFFDLLANCPLHAASLFLEVPTPVGCID